MKIGVPVNENNIKTSVCPSFGRAPFFLIYDTDNRTQIFITNSAAESGGGAGIKAAQTIVDHKIEALLTPRCGENAAKVLKMADIKLYKTEDGLATDNIDAFTADKLAELKSIHPGLHHHGGE